MLSKFLDYFKIEKRISYTDNLYRDYYEQLGGMQFGDGLFNSFCLQDIQQWKENISAAFPETAGKILPFGYTWDGVCFCVDLRDGKIIICDVGDGTVNVLPVSMVRFLNENLPAAHREAMADSDFSDWIRKNGMYPHGSCVGFRVPLFLGGSDDISNREVGDMDVYWSVFGQIKRQVMGN